ncbi:MAG: polysaccharide deacetylase family protein, partial [Bacteroidota bacterium]
YLENVEKCKTAMKAITSYKLQVTSSKTDNLQPATCNLQPLFRPPYGRMKLSQYSLLKSHYSVVLWDVLSGDFDEKLSKEKCLKNVLSNTREGSIVVFHDSVKAKEKLFHVLPKVLEHFSKEEFVFEQL